MKDADRSALFARARREAAPTDDDRRRVRAAIARSLGGAAGASASATAGNAAATVASSGAGAAAALPATLGVAKGIFVVVAMAALGVGALQASSHVASSLARDRAPHARSPAASTASSGALPAGTPAPVPAPVAAPPEPAPTSPSPLVPAPMAPVERPVARALHRVEAVATAAAPLVVSAQAAPLAPLALPADPADLGLVADMQLALRQSDPRRALEAVHEHEVRFPASELAPEREGVKAIALCAGASPRDAARIGAAFVAAHPRSTLVAHVRAACGPRAAADDLDTDREGSGQ